MARRRTPAAARRPYVPAAHYTSEELLAYDIADLESDLKLAEGRDKDQPGMDKYAFELREKIASLRGKQKVDAAG